MRFYRSLQPIKAISFDLDDTLYPNMPIIIAAEQAQFDFLQQHCSAAQATDIKQWQQFRMQLAQRKPELQSDIGQLRQQATYLQLCQLGVAATQASDLAKKAFDAFYQRRIQVDIEPAVMQLLTQLAESYPLVALTNGNACITAMGLADIFQFSLAANLNLAAKPARAMFQRCCQQLAIEPQHLLHVGDSQSSDVQGAINAGCMSVWYNPQRKRLSNTCALPCAEIEDLQQLAVLLPSNTTS